VRTVDPHALVHRSGFWYLVGHDHDRGARRAFRLDRIEGQVAAAGPPGAFAPVADVGVTDVVPSLPPEGPARAEVAVTAAIAWQVARRALGGSRAPAATPDPLPRPAPDPEPAPAPREQEGSGTAARTVFTVPVGDPERFVRWALEYGPDLVVLQPPELRDKVLARLHAAAALRPPADPGSPE
jgi:proteasome accessory factor B